MSTIAKPACEECLGEREIFDDALRDWIRCPVCNPGPRRVQLSRKKGWRMPANTVNVARPGRWGNRFSVKEYGRDLAVLNYRMEAEGKIAIGALDLSALREKNVACWCGLDEACHGDTLLELANRPATDGAQGKEGDCG